MKQREIIKKIVWQVIHNPQVSFPPTSYVITDKSAKYTSLYIDKKDFDSYLKRLEKQLVYRLTTPERGKE